MLWFLLISSYYPTGNVTLAGDVLRVMLMAVEMLTLKEKLLMGALLVLLLAGLGVCQYRQSTEAAIISTQITTHP